MSAIHKGMKYRLRPTPEQEAVLRQHGATLASCASFETKEPSHEAFNYRWMGGKSRLWRARKTRRGFVFGRQAR